MSGTFMSAAMVSGAVALLLQDEPDLNPDQGKYRLMAPANNGWKCADHHYSLLSANCQRVAGKQYRPEASSGCRTLT
jgi:hypothetical protein